MSDSVADTTFSDGEILGLLRSQRRRHILRYLALEHNPADFDDLVDTVAAWENEVPVDEVTTAQRKRVYASLTQTHLPKLDDAGVIDYDEDAAVVRRRPPAEALEQYLDLDFADRGRWPLLYFGASAVGVALVLGHLLPVPVLGAVPPYVSTLAVVGLFLLISGADLFTDA
jgi:hypothetical protein